MRHDLIAAFFVGLLCSCVVVFATINQVKARERLITEAHCIGVMSK